MGYPLRGLVSARFGDHGGSGETHGLKIACRLPSGSLVAVKSRLVFCSGD